MGGQRHDSIVKFALSELAVNWTRATGERMAPLFDLNDTEAAKKKV